LTDLKKQKSHYSGKKKKHTFKAQIVIDKATKLILATSFAKGSIHDFTLLKESKILNKIKQTTKVLADLGYQGIKLHKNSQIPFKKTKKKPLTKEQKAYNREVPRLRIVIENVIATLKVFKILSTKYRSCRKKLTFRFNLICSFVNLEKI
jgi:transposase